MDSEITARRHLEVKRPVAVVRWHVTEFDSGGSYILSADVASTQFQAHFDAEQWAAFQGLIAGAVA